MLFYSRQRLVHILALAGLFLFLTIPLHAQSSSAYEPPKVIPPSPNAASLGIFGQIPVSLFSGIPNINIPIYTIQEGGITVPIELNYHTASVRPENHPGWTGLGWSLNAGGVITREVRGGVDEAFNEGVPPDRTYSYYDNCTFLDRTDWNSQSVMQLYSGYTYPHGPIAEPDEFNFSFGPYSGSFYLSQKKVWTIKSSSHPMTLQIEATLNCNGSECDGTSKDYILWNTDYSENTSVNLARAVRLRRILYSFTITVEDGTKYIFGNQDEAIEFSRNGVFVPMPDTYQTNIVAKSWYLTKILSPDGRSMEFEYVRHGVQFIQSRTCSIFNEQLKGVSNNGNHPVGKAVSVVNPCYLNVIRTYSPNSTVSNQEVWFEADQTKELDYVLPLDILQSTTNVYPDLLYNYPHAKLKPSTWMSLNTISIQRGEVLKEFQLLYKDEGMNPTIRLFLESVQEYGKVGISRSSKPPYRFKYDQPEKMPAYTTGQLDHWGFYNGREFFSQFPATQLFDKSQVPAYYNTREANPAVLTYGILTDITYPTGGITQLDYEPHQYAAIVNRKTSDGAGNFGLDLLAAMQIGTAGGLRVKRITSSDGSGLTPPLVKEYFYLKSYSTGGTTSSGILGGKPNYLDENTISQVDFSYWYWYDNSIQPLSYTGGNHVTYSEVAERSSANNQNGYVIYTYSNHDTPTYRDEESLNNDYSFPYLWLLDPFINREAERGNLLKQVWYNGANKPIKELSYEYNKSTSRFSDNKTNNTSLGAVRAIHYTQRIFFKTANSTSTQWLYDTRVTPYVNYTYPNFVTNVTETTYDANGANPVVNTTSSVYNTNNTLKETSVAESNGALLITRLRYPGDIYTASSGNPTTDVGALALKKMLALNMIGTIVEKQVWEKPAGQTTSQLLTGSLTKFKESYPNKIFPAETYAYRTQGPAISPLATVVTGGVLQLDTYNPGSNDYQGYERVANIEYDAQGNLQAQREEDDVPTSYLWGYNATLPIAETRNAAANQIAHTSFEEETDVTRFSTESITGRKSLKVSYTVPLPSASGTFQLTYWRKSTAANSKWELITDSFSVTNKVIGGGGYLIDEVRVFPMGALMTTYTYDPLVGMTSATDANNVTLYYDYDGLQRLQYVRDQEGDIVKSFLYHYKQ